MGELVERSSDPASTPPSLETLYAELNDLLLAGPELPVFVQELATLASSVVPGTRCVIALRRVGLGVAAVAGDEPAGGPGPSEAALPGGVSVPLAVNGNDMGTLRVLPRADRTFSEAELVRLRAFTRQAAVALTLLLRWSAHATLDAQLQEAMATRAVIDQALGVLMHARKIGSREAFEVLRNASQASNRKVSTVAAEVIEVMTGHPPERPRPLAHRDTLLPPDPTARDAGPT